MSKQWQVYAHHVIDAFSHIYWNEISGFRNILVHNYLGDIDPITVNLVVLNHLPQLLECVKTMLQLDSE